MARNHPENVNPHLGQTAFQRDSYDSIDYAMPYYTSPDLYGRGGCPATTELLVPDLPFDFLQPAMRKQVSQKGYGGPFVIRGNPLGAVVDAIRGFCFPQRMEQTSGDGSTYGYDDPTYSGDNSYYPDAGYGGYSANPAPVPMMPTPTPVMDPMTMTPVMAVDPCGPIAYGIEVAKVGAAAVLSKDEKIKELCRISINARACQNATSGNKTLSNNWGALADQTKGILEKSGCSNCATCISAPAGTTGTGGNTGNTGNAGNTGTTPTPENPNPGSPPTNGSSTSPAPAPAPHPSTMVMPPKETPGKPGGPAGNVFGIPRLLPDVFSGQNVFPSRSMPAMPEMPNPMSLTEGNVFMQPSGDPMGGAFDPRRIQQPGATRRRTQQGTPTVRPRMRFGGF